MNHRHSRLATLAAGTALGLALLTGCPAEEKKDTGAASPGTTTTTTTTTITASAAPAATTAPVAAASPAAGTSTTTTTTTTTTASLSEGETIFAARCQACHGAKGAGGMGPALAAVDAKGDAYIKTTITKGSPAKGMPAFDGQLKPAEIDAVAAYVKAL